MQKELKSFLYKMLIIALFIISLEGLFFVYKMPEAYSNIYILLLAIFLVLAISSHSYLLKSLSKKANNFINMVMMFSGIKILVYLIFMVVYIIVSTNKHVIPFVIIFFIHYIIFTIVELSSILKAMKRAE